MKRNASDAAESSPQASDFPLFILAQASATWPKLPNTRTGECLRDLVSRFFDVKCGGKSASKATGKAPEMSP